MARDFGIDFHSLAFDEVNIILRCSNAEIQNKELKKELMDLYSVNEKLLEERK